jgi:predicted O-linked N-acetylglucosamine transferase (SPINDLY family)
MLSMPEAAASRAIALYRAGQYDEAGQLLQQLVRDGSADATALHVLGLIERQSGRLKEALILMRRAMALRPSDPTLLCNLAMVHGELHDPAPAAALLEEAVRLKPDLAEAHSNLGVALESLGRLTEAEIAHRRALALRQSYPECHNNLGTVLRKLGRLEDAYNAFQRAIEYSPRYAVAYRNLAALCQAAGRSDEALRLYRLLPELSPSPLVHQSLLLALHYHPLDPHDVFEEHVRWGKRHAIAYTRQEHVHSNDRSPNRRLRIGYVSADFRAFPMSRYIEPVLEQHDHERFEIVCYSDVAAADSVTERLKDHADAWRNSSGLSDEQLAGRVRSDRIDILLDLNGHMEGNRLLVFARKPAPIQVTYLSYPDTTGLSTIDYRITDSLHDPPGKTERFHTEALVRLDPCCWCYRPDPLHGPEIVDPPSARSDAVTFACVSRFAKVTAQMLRVWGRILDAVPAARLVLVGEPGLGTDPTARRFLERNGLPLDRIKLLSKMRRDHYFRFYHDVDIVLDTHPYSGHTTTCDALWMGAPVVTLAGATHVSRVSLSMLHSLGLQELAAQDEDQYVRIATDLARDRKRIRDLRWGLRHEMSRSPLMDAKAFTRRLEHFFKGAWDGWLRSPDAR